MKKQLFLSIIGWLMVQSVCAQNVAKQTWNTDLDYLAQELPKRHCNLFAKQSKADFLMGIEAIKAASGRLSDLHIALRTQQLIAGMGDSHTSISIHQLLKKDQTLPLGILWLSDGLYIAQTTKNYEQLLGCRLLSINEIPIATVIDSLTTLFTADNTAIIKGRATQLIQSFELLQFFGFADSQQVKLGVQTQTNENKTYLIEPTQIDRNNTVSLKTDTLPFYLKSKKKFFTDLYQPQERIYYMQYNTCWSRELEAQYRDKEKAQQLPSFKEFEERALSVLNKEQVDKIIFDIRLNGGGNSMQGTAFINKLAVFLNANPTVKTYVVLGRNTFSSAILNAMDFKRLTNAVFIGEETAGKPNHFGEVKSFQLPHSKLIVSYSTKYFKRSDQDIQTLRPDVVIESNFADFKQGVDPVYEWVKKQ